MVWAMTRAHAAAGRAPWLWNAIASTLRIEVSLYRAIDVTQSALVFPAEVSTCSHLRTLRSVGVRNAAE